MKFALKGFREITDTNNVLSFAFLKTAVENPDNITISKNEHFDNKHIAWIKKLIEENIFTRNFIPKMIEKNKDNNESVKKIYDALSTY